MAVLAKAPRDVSLRWMNARPNTGRTRKPGIDLLCPRYMLCVAVIGDMGEDPLWRGCDRAG